MYTTVSIMKMYACSSTMRMWKIAQPSPRSEANRVPASPVAAHIHSSKKRISPAYILPNNRSECDSGFETYSTRLKRKLAGHSSGRAPKGAQNSSWIQPSGPLAAMEKPIISTHRQRERKRGVHVGGRHRAPLVQPEPAEHRGEDVDGQQIHRVHQHHPDEYRERRGRDKSVAIPVLKDAFYLVIDETDQQL